MSIRKEIQQLVEAITPLDVLEGEHCRDVLNWIESGVELFRISQPDNPPKHLAAAFLLIDNDHVLLVDHKKSGLWLPSGGHVEVNEHPKTTVEREIVEELSVSADFIHENPIFLSVQETSSAKGLHEEVCLWYILNGDRTHNYVFDVEEFHTVKWFHMEDVPFEKADPHLERVIQKVKTLGAHDERN